VAAVASDLPFVSVIVPAYNCRATVEQCVESLKALDYPNYEILIMDDGSTDGTAEYLDTVDGIRVMHLENGGPGRARNIALEHARGEYVAFTDADCVVDRGWLHVVGVGGDQQSPADETPFGCRVNDFLKTIGFVAAYVKRRGSSFRRVAHNPTCNVAYKKEVIREIGGFNEKLWPGEDVELDHGLARKGHGFLYTPDAVVYHYRPRTLGAFARMMFRYGWAQAYLVRKYGFFRLVHWEPVALLAILIGLVILFAVNPTEGFVILGLGVIAILAYLFFSALSLTRWLAYIALFFTTLWAWNAGFLSCLLTREKQTRISVQK
jgi:succinoglycan biosynthesis protein ExoA